VTGAASAALKVASITFKTSDCNSIDSYNYVADLCIGKAVYTVVPNRENVGKDPCYGVQKKNAAQSSRCAPAAGAEAVDPPMQAYVINTGKIVTDFLQISNLQMTGVIGFTISMEYSANNATAEEWTAQDTVMVDNTPVVDPNTNITLMGMSNGGLLASACANPCSRALWPCRG
jgi:hypothetical protein